MSTATPHTELPARVNNDDTGASPTIHFEDHLGGTYAWPFELCGTYEAIKPLVGEVYRTHGDDQLVEEVRSARYDIKTAHGAIILPSVWSFFVKPSSTIKISFRQDITQLRDSTPVDVGTRPRSPIQENMSHTFPAARYIPQPRDYTEVVTVDIDDHPSTTFAPYAGSNAVDKVSIEEEAEDSEESSDSLFTLSDQNDEITEDFGIQQIIREVPPLIDADGNTLSFAIDASKTAQEPMTQSVIEEHGRDRKLSQDSERVIEASTEKYRITKAVISGTEARTVLQVYTLPGPDNDKLHDSVQLTWYHMHSSQLDLNGFKDICLRLPNLPTRLRSLVVEAFAQVERHKVKAFLDGFFIEPGTVLRTIDKGQSGPEAVIFSCIPYLELQRPTQKVSSKPGARLFPPRTLMQAMYPYEPVRDRDSEQAYKKLGADQSHDLIYVPNLWMMNIGTAAVVTYGHRPLAEEMTKSIEVIKEDVSQVGAIDIAKTSLTTVRLINEEALVYIYSLESCRSYFQMETAFGRPNSIARRTTASNRSKIIWNSPSGKIAVTARNWSSIIKRTDLISIDLEVIPERSVRSPSHQINLDELIAIEHSVPPFFHWPSTSSKKSDTNKAEPHNFTSVGPEHEIECLEHAEKGMLTETLDTHSTVNAVDRSFASTSYYQSLPQETGDYVRTQFETLCSRTSGAAGTGYHATVVATQCKSIVAKSESFCKIVQATLSLFVCNTSKSSILGKVWSAMSNIHRWAAQVQARGILEPGPTNLNEVGNQRHRTITTGWYIRGGKEGTLPPQHADKNFKRSVKHCRWCRSASPFDDAEAAVDHLRSHLKPDATYVGKSEGQSLNRIESADKLKLSDWVIHSKQLEREQSNAGGLEILTQACEDALDLLRQIKELADGVKDEDGKKSDLFTFPRELIEAFRKLIVFYLATERALYHTEESYQRADEEDSEGYELPYSEDGLRVLKRFAQGVANSVVIARNSLCSMAEPETSTDSMQNLSLGPEYICGWLMRRLLAKPLQKHMSVSDIYREYLSTIQFQVNHRPSKRLIRDLNLLQEELQVLAMINTWQTNLIQNYLRVLDDSTYEVDVPSRRAMFPYERALLYSCLENSKLVREEYDDLIRRCGPLSDQTKQSLEIYEEDHGKAITAFTVVTVIFLPLSFVTSYLGMNTIDIRDMASGQSLFWNIALPLTFITIGATVLIGYNGDVLRDFIARVYYKIIGKQDSMPARGISVAQRKHAKQLRDDANDSLDTSIADQVEYARPQPDINFDELNNNGYVPYTYPEPVSQMAKIDPYVPAPRTGFRTQRLRLAPIPPPIYERPTMRYGVRHISRPLDHRVGEAESISMARPMPDTIAYDVAIRQGEDDGLQDEYMWHKKRRHRHFGDEGRRRR